MQDDITAFSPGLGGVAELQAMSAGTQVQLGEEGGK